MTSSTGRDGSSTIIAADAQHKRSRRLRISTRAAMAASFPFSRLSSLLLLAFVAFASASSTDGTSFSELDAKSIDMARRVIQKLKDYSNNNDVEQQPSLLPSSWQMLLHTLEKSFLGIVNGAVVEEDDNGNSKNNYSSTSQEASARLQALQWLTLDYGKSVSSSSSYSSANHQHHKDDHHNQYYESGLLDRYALATIYYATNGKDWTYDDAQSPSSSASSSSSDDQQLFLSSASHLQWSGVNGNNRDGHVTMLDLSHRNLVSNSFLPLEIVLLSPTLELLWLSDNMGLSGSLPDYLGDFASLSSLSIYQTSMSGTLPETLYNLPKLSSLRLYKSNFSGGISSSIGKLVGLRWLWLHDNRFSGVLPQELGLLSKLEGMTLHGNEFDTIDVMNGDGLRSNIIPESVCTNLVTAASNVGGVGSTSGGELKHLWTDCEEDSMLVVEDGGESKILNSASVKACSCCTRCFPRKTKTVDDEMKLSVN